MITNTDLRKNPVYVSLYVVWSKIIFIEIIPYFAIVIMNIFIITKITKSTRFRKRFQRHDPEPNADAYTGPPLRETVAISRPKRISSMTNIEAIQQGPSNIAHDAASHEIKPLVDKNKHKPHTSTGLTSQNNGTQEISIRVSEEGQEEKQEGCHPHNEEEHSMLKATDSRCKAQSLNSIGTHATCHKTLSATLSPPIRRHHHKNNISKQDSSENEIQISGDSGPTARCSNSTTNDNSIMVSTRSSKPSSFGSSNSGSHMARKRPTTQKRTFLRKQQEEHSLGIILILMSILFIVCQSLKIVPDIYEIIVCRTAEKYNNDLHSCEFPGAIVKLTNVSHLLLCINSSANFLIYYCAGGKFREAWLDTYGCWWCCCSGNGLRDVCGKIGRFFVPAANSSQENSPGRTAHGSPEVEMTIMNSPSTAANAIKLTPTRRQSHQPPVTEIKLTPMRKMSQPTAVTIRVTPSHGSYNGRHNGVDNVEVVRCSSDIRVTSNAISPCNSMRAGLMRSSMV